MEDQYCIIEDLLATSFLLRNEQEQLQVVANGRPCPDMPDLSTKHKGKKEEYTRHFSVSQYTLIPWLAGCGKLNKLFCWPCLLFSSDKGMWANTGFADLSHLNVAQHRHEKSETHLKSFLKWKLFGKQTNGIPDDSKSKAKVRKHNEQVKRNREVLRRSIDAICFLAKQGIPLEVRDEQNDPEDEDDRIIPRDKGNYIELLELVRTYDPILNSHLQAGDSFLVSTPTIQVDIIDSLRDVIMDNVKEDVMSASFVSLMIDETSDIMSKSQLSTVLRFIKDGEIRECFVGFTDISSNRTAEGLIAHVTGVVKEFQIENKLVAQTYDGAALRGDHLNELQANVLEAYPKALFTHCHTHVLNIILQQSLCTAIKECKIFFLTLNGLSMFFSKSLNRKIALEDFLVWKQPWISPTKWDLTSRLVQTVKTYRTELKEFFEHIVENSDEWDPDTVIQSMGFISFFSEFNTSFLLQVLSKLFSYTDEIHELLQNIRLDIIFCVQKVIDVLLQLQNDKQYAFETHWNEVYTQEEQSEAEPSTKKARLSVDVEVYRQLFYEVVDNIVQQIETRYGGLSKLQFLQLLSHEHFNNYQSVFPDDPLDTLKFVHESLFDFIKLKSELSVLYSNKELQGFPVAALLKYIRNNDLTCIFKEVYKLAELILTMPCFTSFSESSSSALDRIINYRSTTQEQDPPNNLCFVAIENTVLQEIKLKDSFYDKVVEKLLCKQKREELTYM